MKNILQSLLLGILVLGAFSGCYKINSMENIVLNNKGDGSVAVYVQMKPMSNAEASEMMKKIVVIGDETRGIGGTRVESAKGKERGGAFTAIVNFDSLYSLMQFFTNLEKLDVLEKNSVVMDEWDWSFIDFLNIEIRRTIPHNKGKVGYESYALGSTCQYTYTLPRAPLRSNAHNTVNEGKTLIWQFDAAHLNALAMEGKAPELLFTLNPWYILPQNTLMGILGGLFGAVVAGIFIIFRKLFKKKTVPKKSGKSNYSTSAKKKKK